MQTVVYVIHKAKEHVGAYLLKYSSRDDHRENGSDNLILQKKPVGIHRTHAKESVS